MAAISYGTSQERAAKRFPYSGRSRIRGAGEHALVFKCYHPWRVNLYPTVEERDEAWQRFEFSYCGALRCTHDHSKVDL